MLAKLDDALLTAPDGPPPGQPIADRLLRGAVPRRMRQLVDYWERMRGARRMPRFADIDPVDIPWALSTIFVISALDDGRGFRYRLSGEEINRRYGRNLAGKEARELFKEPAVETITTRWRRVIDEPAACRAVCRHDSVENRMFVGDRVLLPLSTDGRRADHILGLTVFQEERDLRGREIVASHTISADWVEV